jgi:type II secretion system (T2SS) protein E
VSWREQRDQLLFWKNSLQCENPGCAYRNPLRRLLRQRNTGVHLQGRWYCSLDCFEQGIASAFAGLIRLPDEPIPRLHRIPLGLMLLGKGVIDEGQLKAALRAQREQGNERLGRWLVRLGIASAHDVSAALAAQWGCGVFPLEQDRRYRECSQMLPLALLQSSRMLPVHYLAGSQLLFLAFSEDIDHSAIYAIERLSGNRTKPCVVTEAAMDQALDELRSVSRPGEIVFETMWDAPEMARTIRDYAVKLGADELILARPRRFLWVRLKAGEQCWDLMFRLPAATPADISAVPTLR